MAKNPYEAYKSKDQGGYQNTPQPGDPSYTEAWAMIESARRMAITIESGALDDKAGRDQARQALRLNWRLWTIFQAELTSEMTTVPEEIRLNMLTLCKFVDSQTIKTLSETSIENILPLIDMNRNIASGLLGNMTGEGEEEATTEDSKEGETIAEDSPPPEPSKPFVSEA